MPCPATGSPPLFCLVEFCYGDLILHQKGIGFLIFWAFFESCLLESNKIKWLWIKLRKIKRVE